MVTVNNLGVLVHNQLILKSISCELPVGRITAFIGKSGAGKTTLLKALVGLVPIAEGLISSNHQKISSLSPRQRSETIGYVFQDFNLFQHFTVLQNCIDPLVIRGMSRADAQERALKTLAVVGMDNFTHKYPAELSGGQQQRVAVARTLCLQPRIILLDEPTASLDPLNTDILVTILKQLAAQGLTVGVSSQDMSFVRKVFDRVYYMASGTIAESCDTIKMIDSCPLIKEFIKIEYE